MRISKNFNNISDQLRGECIPEFKRDEVKTFRLLNGVVNNDPDITERLKRPVFYPDTQLRTYDRIFDPFLNDNKGGYVDIGVAEQFDIATDGTQIPKKFKCIVRGHGIGMFTLQGNSIDDRELYEHFCISNENANFKYRDAKITPLFEEILPLSENEEAEKEFDNLLEAGTALKKLNTNERRQVATALYLDPTYDDKTILIQLQTLAMSDPETLLESIKSVKQTVGSHKRAGRPTKDKVFV